jgi:hypothetical protein
VCDLMTTSWRSASVCQQFRDVAEPEVRLKELRGALPQGGRVAIVSQPRCPGSSAETTERVAEETQAPSRRWLHQPPQGDPEPAVSSGLRSRRSSLPTPLPRLSGAVVLQRRSRSRVTPVRASSELDHQGLVTAEAARWNTAKA